LLDKMETGLGKIVFLSLGSRKRGVVFRGAGGGERDYKKQYNANRDVSPRTAEGRPKERAQAPIPIPGNARGELGRKKAKNEGGVKTTSAELRSSMGGSM